MFLIAGVLLGIAGTVSLVFVIGASVSGMLGEYRGTEYWASFCGALIRNTLMAAAGYAAFKQPTVAPVLAWAALGAYVLFAVGNTCFRDGRFHASNLVATFYATTLFIAVCAVILTVVQPPYA